MGTVLEVRLLVLPMFGVAVWAPLPEREISSGRPVAVVNILHQVTVPACPTSASRGIKPLPRVVGGGLAAARRLRLDTRGA